MTFSNYLVRVFERVNGDWQEHLHFTFGLLTAAKAAAREESRGAPGIDRMAHVEAGCDGRVLYVCENGLELIG